MASIFTPARPATTRRSINHKTHKNSKPTFNFATRNQENVDLFTNDKKIMPSGQDACFSVEFAMMSFEEQLIKCQLGEGDLNELRDQFDSVPEVVVRRLANR